MSLTPYYKASLQKATRAKSSKIIIDKQPKLIFTVEDKPTEKAHEYDSTLKIYEKHTNGKYTVNTYKTKIINNFNKPYKLTSKGVMEYNLTTVIEKIEKIVLKASNPKSGVHGDIFYYNSPTNTQTKL